MPREIADTFLIQVEKLIDTSTASQEQVLFLSVILQAMLDATKPVTAYESNESKDARTRAHNWFFDPIGVTAEDFETICDLADIDPTYIRSFAYKVLKTKEIDYVRKRINAVITFY